MSKIEHTKNKLTNEKRKESMTRQVDSVAICDARMNIHFQIFLMMNSREEEMKVQ